MTCYCKLSRKVNQKLDLHVISRPMDHLIQNLIITAFDRNGYEGDKNWEFYVIKVNINIIVRHITFTSC